MLECHPNFIWEIYRKHICISTNILGDHEQRWFSSFGHKKKKKNPASCKVIQSGSLSGAPTGLEVGASVSWQRAPWYDERAESGLTFEVFVQDVLEAVEDGFVIFDFSAFGGICPLLAALKVGVHFTRVGGVLFIMCHLQRESGRD